MRTINPDQLAFKSTASSTDWCAHWAVQSQRDGTAWKSLADLHFQICDRLRANSSAVGLHMTACPISGSDRCINPNFCRACRDADRRKAQGERPCHAPLRPGPPPMADLPQANLDSKNWKEIAAEAWTSPSWKQAALEYHHARGNRTLIVEILSEDLARLRRLMSDSVSLDRAWDEITRTARERYNEAPKATYDAVVYELRTYGLPQLSKPNCQRRLSDLSAAQIKAVMASLQARRNEYPNVNDELLKALAQIYSEKVGGDE